jgi:hypothetical protein
MQTNKAIHIGVRVDRSIEQGDGHIRNDPTLHRRRHTPPGASLLVKLQL